MQCIFVCECTCTMFHLYFCHLYEKWARCVHCLVCGMVEIVKLVIFPVYGEMDRWMKRDEYHHSENMRCQLVAHIALIQHVCVHRGFTYKSYFFSLLFFVYSIIVWFFNFFGMLKIFNDDMNWMCTFNQRKWKDEKLKIGLMHCYTSIQLSSWITLSPSLYLDLSLQIICSFYSVVFLTLLCKTGKAK